MTNARKKSIIHTMKANSGWFKKGYKMTEEHKAKISKNNARFFLGKKLTEEHINNLRLSHLGKPRGGSPDRWKHSKETREKISMATRVGMNNPIIKEKCRQHRLAQKMSNKETSIELKIEQLLKENNIIYRKQVPMYGVGIVDFLLEDQKLIVECDGYYWHNKPGVKERDEARDKALSQNGYTTIRLLEHEIKNSLDICFNKIRSNLIN